MNTCFIKSERRMSFPLKCVPNCSLGAEAAYGVFILGGKMLLLSAHVLSCVGCSFNRATESKILQKMTE